VVASRMESTAEADLVREARQVLTDADRAAYEKHCQGYHQSLAPPRLGLPIRRLTGSWN
jgi:hypothetical protein